MGLREEKNSVGIAGFSREFFDAGVAIFLELGTDAAECFLVGC